MGSHNFAKGLIKNMTEKNKIKTESITYSYKDKKAITNLSFTLSEGKYLTILGASGCGKTTLLRLLGGYLKPSEGSIYLNSTNITSMDPGIREIGMVFQNYALFPHLSAKKNISFPLEIRRISKIECEKKVNSICDIMGLTSNEMERKPTELSGGQQQRVALARALVFEPQVLLLDEPFANLDKNIKIQLRNEIRKLQKSINITTIMVTHDHEEAFSNSDFIGIMHEGKLLQIGDPKTIYDKPNSRFVASFLGETNLIPAMLFNIANKGLVHIRPEKIKIGKQASQCNFKKEATITAITFMGSYFLIEIKTSEGFHLKVTTRDHENLLIGSNITFGIETESIWLISETNEISQ